MAIPVMRYQRNKIMSDPASQVLNYLKVVPGHARLYTIKDVAEETEAIGGMSAEDVTHVMKSFIRSLRKILVKGDKVKIDDLGIFYTTFNCEGTEDEKDCTVKNIRKVNVRFAVDNTLRLVNDSTATTRGAANNVEFYVKSDVSATGNTNGDNGGDDGGGEVIDPGF
ncbi:DNA-binding protein [Bacteroides sp. 51]|uniref:HU family DNA-binding protein n=1 Tax=Bacteroides sp. 51 TaxID=2302938 RepID=UPI0013D85458|nr:DNA-binding protein [Bacteroides sp. 51]NDV84702.1 DNA-binding protein [Bacteroides sp. 51]